MTKILCVEDDDDSAFMLKRRLQRHGYEVAIAVNGNEGVARARQEQPDLILMDIDLPELNGLEATRLLKSAPETSAIPVVVLTAHAMVGDRERCLDAGMDSYLSKPVQIQDLKEALAMKPPNFAMLGNPDETAPIDIAAIDRVRRQMERRRGKT